MAVDRFPARLRLIGQADGALAQDCREPAELRTPIPFPGAAAFMRDPLCAVATRRGLMARLELVAGLAPHAPLSFIVVKVYGLAELNSEAGRAAGDLALQAIAAELRQLTRATDLVGRMSGGTFGVVLQGTGTTAAAAVAARLSHRLAQLPEAVRPIEVAVSAATGTGLNFETLPVAALDSFEDCG